MESDEIIFRYGTSNSGDCCSGRALCVSFVDRYLTLLEKKEEEEKEDISPRVDDNKEKQDGDELKVKVKATSFKQDTGTPVVTSNSYYSTVSDGYSKFSSTTATPLPGAYTLKDTKVAAAWGSYYSRVLCLRCVPDFMIPSELIGYFIASLSDIVSIRICEYNCHRNVVLQSGQPSFGQHSSSTSSNITSNSDRVVEVEGEIGDQHIVGTFSKESSLSYGSSTWKCDDFIAFFVFRSVPCCIEFYEAYQGQVLSSVGSVVKCEFLFVQELELDSSSSLSGEGLNLDSTSGLFPGRYSHSKEAEAELASDISSKSRVSSSSNNVCNNISHSNSKSVVGSLSRSNSPSLSCDKVAVEVIADNCSICLSALDTSQQSPRSSDAPSATSAVLTTFCNHTFHVTCLQKLEDPRCPICRYQHDSSYGHFTCCVDCPPSDSSSALIDDGENEGAGQEADLWVCLLCGYVGCGSKSGDRMDHIRRHYKSTFHAYAMRICDHAVWDFAGDGYVHRIVLSNPEGGFAGDLRGDEEFLSASGGSSHSESTATSSSLSSAATATTISLPSSSATPAFLAPQFSISSDGLSQLPGSPNTHRSRDPKLVEVGPTQYSSFERPAVAPISSHTEEFLIHKKLEAMAFHYNQVLMWQCQQSRATFEARLRRLRKFALEEGQNSRELGSGSGSSHSSNARWADAISKSLGLEKDRITRQTTEFSKRIEELKREKSIQAELSRAIYGNVEGIDKRLESSRLNLQKAEKEYREKVSKLELELQAAREKIK